MSIYSSKLNPISIVSNKRLERLPTSPPFIDQLGMELKKMGYKIGHNFTKHADVALIVESTEQHYDQLVRLKEKGTKVVQRIDGIHGNPGGIIAEEPKNKKMANTYSIADAVIFQSEFCKEVWERHFQPKRPEVKNYVILNGADERYFSREGSKHNKLEKELRKNAKYIIVTAARWRRWKNLEQMVDVMDRLDRDDCILAVVGRLDLIKPIEHPRVRYLGLMGHKDMGKFFRSADLFMYLAWFDWCPKAVSQALLAGLPVICSKRGGTKELVQDCGIVVPSKDENNLEDYETPIPVDINATVEAIDAILNDPSKYSRPRFDLSLSEMTRKYLDVFFDVAGKKHEV